jgi:hypothetical protein
LQQDLQEVRKYMADIAAVAIIICAAALASAQAPTPAPTLRSGINLVALTVTVERADGSYVSSLRSDDFRVFEAGVEQNVDFFGAGEVPIDLILMLDTSASMSGRLHIAQRAAINLLNALRPPAAAARAREAILRGSGRSAGFYRWMPCACPLARDLKIRPVSFGSSCKRRRNRVNGDCQFL